MSVPCTIGPLMIEALDTLFRKMFGELPTVVARAPGRVNLIGEHTDYNDGFVLPCAIGKQTLAAVSARADGMVHVIAADLGGLKTSFSLREPVAPSDAAPWSNYVRGMVHGLMADGLPLTGANIALIGNMPQGAGLSSSAALENAVGLALAALGGRPDIDRTQLALLGQRTEHDFAGCKCGIMDQLVSARAEEGAALLIDCRSLEATPISIPPDLAIMIVHSGITRGLVDGEYNARRAQCEAAALHYGVAALRDLADVPPQGALDDLAYRSARHVITENARTLAAADALNAGNAAKLGQLMAESHDSMRDDFEITLPAIDDLVALLQKAIGAEGGARMTGGGFGGAVVALLPASGVDDVTAAVRAGYQTPSGLTPDIQIEKPAQGATILR
jgi:galactokinase